MPWKEELLQSYSSVEDLLAAGLIPLQEASRLKGLGNQYKVKVTPYYASLFDPTDPHCPIRAQAIPSILEEDLLLPKLAQEKCQEIYGRKVPWQADAIGDLKNLVAPRLTHRYRNRAILHVTSSCGVYCRFCFRKSHLNDRDHPLYEGSLEPAFQYLENHPEIRELILTGGDPLSLSDLGVERLLNRAGRIPSLRVTRVHSRNLVTLPSRFTTELVAILSEKRSYRPHLVSHFNHPREITPLVMEKINLLTRSGLSVFNQSVLLRAVNDDVTTLADLFQRLYELGVAPLYLHHPDWTPGTFHFRVSIERGRALFSKLRGRVSGPALPEYVLDVPQGYGKISLMENSVRFEEELPVQMGIGGGLYSLDPPVIREEIQAESSREGHPTRYLDLFKA